MCLYVSKPVRLSVKRVSLLSFRQASPLSATTRSKLDLSMQLNVPEPPRLISHSRVSGKFGSFEADPIESGDGYTNYFSCQTAFEHQNGKTSITYTKAHSNFYRFGKEPKYEVCQKLEVEVMRTDSYTYFLYFAN